MRWLGAAEKQIPPLRFASVGMTRFSYFCCVVDFPVMLKGVAGVFLGVVQAVQAKYRDSSLRSE
jgi:hypothetical protein